MARLKLLNRLAKFKGKCNALINLSSKQRLDNLDDELNNQINANDDEDDEISSLKARLNTDKISIDDFICTCCFEILYNPITLLCGHNICSVCLANWFLISSKRICPTCRQDWIGSPKANIVLKNTIEQMFPNQISKRKLNLDEKLTRETQEKFEKKCKLINYTINDDTGIGGGLGQNLPNNQQQNGFLNNIRNPNRLVKYTILSFLSGLFIGITVCASILLGCFFIWYLNNTYSTSSAVNKYLKPTYLWNEKETYEWLQQLGPWSLTQIAPIAYKIKLNGTGLLDLQEEQLLSEPFNMTDNFYRELLIDSINALKYRSSMPKPNLWEFKNAYRLKVIFSTMIFDSFPRITLLSIYYFDFNLFNEIKNIIEYGYSNFNENVILSSFPTQTTITTSASISLFMFYAMQFPYIYLSRLLNECFYETNGYTIKIITINCYLLTVLEICRKYNLIRAIFYRRFLPYVRKSISSYLKKITVYILLMILWFILPTFIFDCIFVYCIYFKIFYNSYILFRFLKRFSYLVMLNYF